MKNLIKLMPTIAVYILTVAMFPSCSDKGDKNELLTSKIQYDVPVVNSDPQLDWWINNIEGSRREPFLKRIMEAAEKGEVRVYDYFENPLTTEQVKSIGVDTIYKTLIRPYPPYDEYDTMIIRAISYHDIVKIRYLEEWSWDPAGLEIEKNVLAFGPVISKEISGESYNQLLFWIHTADGKSRK